MYFIITEQGGVRVFGDDRLAFKGHSVQFKCEAAGWYPHATLQWRVDDKQVNTQLQSDTLVCELMFTLLEP